MAFYVESVDRPHVSYPVGEDVHVGELVTEVGGNYERFDAADHNDFDGVADDPQSADWISVELDEASNFLYESADNERAPAAGEADGDIIKVRTPEDTGGNESAPSISDGDVVGVIDTSAGTLNSTVEYEGRVVQEGYDDGEGTPTTYNRSNDNFIAVGTALKDSVSDWDEVIRVKVAGGDRSNL